MSDPFTTAERQRANYLGELRPAKDGLGWTGHMTSFGGGTIILAVRPQQEPGQPERLIVLGRFGQTDEAKALKAKASRPRTYPAGRR